MTKIGWTGSPSAWIGENKYEVYKSDVVISNQSKLIDMLLEFHHNTEYRTSNFDTYNIFTEITCDEMYDLFLNVQSVIRSHIPKGRLWMQSWVNVHKQDECLDWHHHFFPFHGYISIDPKKTTTEFVNWKVKNEVGNIYFGLGGEANSHRVNIDEAYDDHRITIGFDVQSVATQGRNKFIPV
jgi:hypothetical protein